MKLRFSEISDEDKIRAIHKKFHADKFPLPTPRHRISCVVVEDDLLIGSVIVKLRPEATLILDTSRDTRTKVEALNLLYHATAMNLRHQEFEDAIVFTDFQGLDKILEKHYNFKPISGKALILDLE